MKKVIITQFKTIINADNIVDIKIYTMCGVVQKEKLNIDVVARLINKTETTLINLDVKYNNEEEYKSELADLIAYNLVNSASIVDCKDILEVMERKAKRGEC